MFPAENNFLQLLAFAKDQKQKKKIIRFINRSQLKVVKNIAQKILNGNIHLKNKEFHFLKNKKLFLRKLSQGKIKITDLPREHTIVCYIVKLVLQHNEMSPKISSRSSRKMGKNRRQYSCERSASEISFSDKCFSSSSSEKVEDSYFSDEESEKPGRFGDRCVPERNSVSFSNSREEGESIETV